MLDDDEVNIKRRCLFK